MFITVLTFALIAVILGGVGYYGYRRATKVWRQNQARSRASEAALLAAVVQDAPAGTRRELRALVSSDTLEPIKVADATSSPTEAEAPPAQVDVPPSDSLSPVTVEEVMRSFFGNGAANGQPPVVGMDLSFTPPSAAPPTSNESTKKDQGETLRVEARDTSEKPPPPGTSFDAAVARLALLLRDAADEIERTAATHGTPSERATNTFAAVTAAISKLPLTDLLTTNRDNVPTNE